MRRAAAVARRTHVRRRRPRPLRAQQRPRCRRAAAAAARRTVAPHRTVAEHRAVAEATVRKSAKSGQAPMNEKPGLEPGFFCSTTCWRLDERVYRVFLGPGCALPRPTASLLEITCGGTVRRRTVNGWISWNDRNSGRGVGGRCGPENATGSASRMPGGRRGVSRFLYRVLCDDRRYGGGV